MEVSSGAPSSAPVSYAARLFGFVGRLLSLNASAESDSGNANGSLVDELRRRQLAAAAARRRLSSRAAELTEQPPEAPMSRAAAYVSSLSWPPNSDNAGATDSMLANDDDDAASSAANADHLPDTAPAGLGYVHVFEF